MMEDKLNELEKSFKVLKMLGQGSYGRVYLCKYKDPKKRKGLSDLVAIKRIECESVEKMNDFLKEIVEIRDLEHKNIVKYHDGFIDKVEDKYFVNIVMEYLPGFQICEILEYIEKNENGDCPSVICERFLINILSQMIDALHEIHRKNIIHRDISTNNIMVFVKEVSDSIFFETSKPISPFNKKDGKNIDDHTHTPTPKTPKLDHTIPELVELPPSKLQFKLLDFGFVTRKLSEESLIDSFSVGTPDFQSPEILTRRSYNELTDIWSLGGVLLNFALSKQAHVYATLTSQNSQCHDSTTKKTTPQNEPKTSDPHHPLYDVLLKRGYSTKFLDILFQMLEIEPENRIKTSDLKIKVDKELISEMEQKEKELLEKSRMDRVREIHRKNEKVKNIPILKSQTIVSVNQSTNLSLWNWKEQKITSTIFNAHTWTISDIMSLSAGNFVNNASSSSSEGRMEKLILASGGSSINLIRIDGQKMLNRKSRDCEDDGKQDGNFYEIVKSFRSESKIEVLCPIFKDNEDYTSIFSSGSMDSTIEIWKNTDDYTDKNERVKSTKKLSEHKDSVVTLCSFHDGIRLASGSKDRTVRIWDLEKGVSMDTIKDSKYITGLNYYRKKDLLSFANSYGMSVRFYDLRSGSTVKSHRCGSIALTQFITGFRFIGDNYMCVGDNLRLNCFDVRYLHEDSEGGIKKLWVKKFPVNDIMILQDSLFAICSREGSIKVFDVDGTSRSKMEEDVGGMYESRTCICRL